MKTRNLQPNQIILKSGSDLLFNHLKSTDNMLLTNVLEVLFGHCPAVNVFSLQAFYPANKEVTVKYGDTIAARCLFTGEGRTTKTYIG